jgi:enterochelin esterase family protein
MAREILTQFFGAQLGDASRAEDLFPANGDEIRGLVQRRMVLMFDSRMTQIGHQRPGVSGGPGAPPGLPLDQARAKAALIAEEIRSRMATTEPEVAPGGRVTFRVRAPNAREVRVQYEGGGDTGNMQKDEDGLWSFMTPPLEPDIYSYTFFVDGLRSIDLNNPLLKYNLLYTDNQVEVRGTTALPWEMQDVPHGQLHRHFYKSAATGEDRDFYVYTPPGYSPQWHRYPVLYLLHGISDDASGWTVAGRQNVILDNLIARGAAKPMVVVMPLGYGTMDMVRQGWSRISSAGRWETNLQQFRARLLDEVMPQVEASYRLSNHPQDRAIAGLSMGGAESLFVGLTEPKRFAWIGAFSSGGVGANFLELLPTLDSSANHRLGLLWISCGKNDSLYDSNQALVESLKGKGIHCTWREVPGEHSWRVWRPNLVEFAPLLFH